MSWIIVRPLEDKVLCAAGGREKGVEWIDEYDVILGKAIPVVFDRRARDVAETTARKEGGVVRPRTNLYYDGLE